VAEGPSADPGPHGHDVEGAPHGSGAHDERHELSIASLVDRDLPDDERAEAERLLATCPACAGLHHDLVSLAAAARALPAPPRPRDFRLTAREAARLRFTNAREGEPHGVASRLTGEMQDSPSGHGAHDQLLVASLLDRSTGGPDRERAEALIAACNDCATLHRDLIALRDAARALPTPPRTRTFEITAEDASKFRRTGWRRLIAAFGSTRDAFSRPLAIGLTTIGLAGLLVATIPGVLPRAVSTAALPTLGQAVGGAGANSEALGESKLTPIASAAPSAPAPAAAALTAPSTAPTGAAATAAPAAEPAPTGEAFDTFVGAPAASAGAAAVAPARDTSPQRDGADATRTSSIDAQSAGSPDRLAVIALAGLLLVVGVSLFALRWLGRRI
jgi:hypothetical protein